ncbi:MAG: GNAT family N-acetyltransferase [Cycloclasticus sp.]
MAEFSSKDFKYRQMELSDVDEIVEIHLQSFEDGILTAFGKYFLSKMYELYLRKGNYGCVVTSSNKVIGFCLGTSNAVNLTKILNLRLVLNFIWSLLLKPRMLLRVLSGLNGVPSIEVGNKDIELSHIALAPNSRSLGIGSELVHYFEVEVRARGFCGIITRTHNEALSDYYIREKAASVVSRFNRSGVEYIVVKWSLGKYVE